MSSKNSLARHGKSKTVSRKSQSQGGAAKVSTVTDLFQKQFQKNEQDRPVIPGAHGMDPDHGNDVVFIKEECCSPYFKCTNTDSSQSHNKATQEESMGGRLESNVQTEQRKLQLSQRLSLRKKSRENQNLSRTESASSRTSSGPVVDQICHVTAESKVKKCRLDLNSTSDKLVPKQVSGIINKQSPVERSVCVDKGPEKHIQAYMRTDIASSTETHGVCIERSVCVDRGPEKHIQAYMRTDSASIIERSVSDQSPQVLAEDSVDNCNIDMLRINSTSNSDQTQEVSVDRSVEECKMDQLLNIGFTRNEPVHDQNPCVFTAKSVSVKSSVEKCQIDLLRIDFTSSSDRHGCCTESAVNEGCCKEVLHSTTGGQDVILIESSKPSTSLTSALCSQEGNQSNPNKTADKNYSASIHEAKSSYDAADNASFKVNRKEQLQPDASLPETAGKFRATSKGRLSLKHKSTDRSDSLPVSQAKTSSQTKPKPSEEDDLTSGNTNATKSTDATASESTDKFYRRTKENTDRESGEIAAENSKEGKQFLVPYYLENFREIVRTVMEDDYHTHLFNEADLKYVAAFNSLTEESQKLYVRLFSRKLAWLPMSRIKYTEIAKDLTPFLGELVSASLLSSDEKLQDLSCVLGVLSAPDLRTLAKVYHLNTASQQKGQIIQALLAKSQQKSVATMFGQKSGSLVQVMLNRAKKLLGHMYRQEEEPRRLFIRIMMLFSLANTTVDEESGGGGQAQLFQMLLVNIGQVVYPAYTVNRQTRIFRDRESLTRFEEALQLESELLGRTGSGDWTGAYSVFQLVKEQYDDLLVDIDRTVWDSNLPEFLRYYTAGSALVRLLHQGIDILQRRKDYLAAVSLIRELLSQSVYNLDHRGFWWDRLALNFDVHLRQQELALQAIQDGLADPAVRTGHRLALYLRAESICNKPRSPHKQRLKDFCHEPLVELPKMYVEGRVLADAVGGRIHQFMTNDSWTDDRTGDITLCNVEQVVLDHYKGNGYPQGFHAEGSIVSLLFTLFFWDILFMDVVDAFHSPYQTLPLDFHTDAFYQQRQASIDGRLAEIENSAEEDLQKMMTETWETHYSVVCSSINWERFSSIEQIKGLISCMGGRVLACLLCRYARQPRHTRGGFPDLTLWNTDTKQLKICEVKGPGDRLSHKQMLWLDHLLKLGVDAEVCHVRAVGAKKLKRSSSSVTS